MVQSQSANLPLGAGSVASPALPDFSPASDASFTWGSMDSHSFCHTLEATFQEVVHWRSNCFKIPYGNVGKRFVLEIARLFRAAGEGSSLESITLKAAFTLCSLVLQKPARNSKKKDHISCLERRLNKWKDGDLNDLVLEGRTIQQRFTGKGRLRDQNSNSDRKAYSFAKLMFDGKTKPALDLLSGVCNGRRLGLNEIVDAAEDIITAREVLETKHPIPAHHPVIFEALDGSVIRAAALQASGAAGPSGVDAYVWQRLCSSFKSASDELCCSIAVLARRLCTSFVDSSIVAPLLTCRLIALDKYPGVRPIGVGEVVRRIIAKAVLSIVGTDIQQAAGLLQFCAGHTSGMEAAIHSMSTVFAEEKSESILLVDTSNALNSLIRAVALQNIQHLCPVFSTILINTYHSPAALFVDGDVLYSNEGTMQGDPLAMPFYALATFPLIHKLSKSVVQAWYADDACACGELHGLHLWWDQVLQFGPPFGYFPNAKKTWLVVKEQFLDHERHLFSDTCVYVTGEGRPYLGAAIGSRAFIENCVAGKVASWVTELELLASFAVIQPHAAFSAFSRGVVSKWLFIARTVPHVGHLYQPLKDCVRHHFVPSVTGRPSPGDLERDLFALPARLGG